MLVGQRSSSKTRIFKNKYSLFTKKKVCVLYALNLNTCDKWVIRQV